MPIFAVTYSYDPALAERRTELLSEHRAWLRTFDDDDRILGAGIFPDGSGSLLVLTAASLDDMRRGLAEDPFAVAGLVTQVDVREWSPNWGVLADRAAAGTSS